MKGNAAPAAGTGPVMRVQVTIESNMRAAAQAAARPPGVPDLTMLSGLPRPDAAPARRPWGLALGKHLRTPVDRILARYSLASNAPVLDMRDFAWTAGLRDAWQAIRDEALAVAVDRDAAPPLARISPDHRGIARADAWRTFFLWGYGYRFAENIDRCPATARALAAVPGLNSAFFSILAPGTHIPPHRGVTKGLITCHLGLIVPRDGDARMRVGDRMVRWAEGETLVFDDSYDHEVWNDSSGTRVVLLIQFRRPLRQPGRWLAETVLRLLRRSAFVQEARANVRRWNAARGG